MRIPDWSERDWTTAAYPYQAPDAPSRRIDDWDDEWDAHVDDYDDLGAMMNEPL